MSFFGNVRDWKERNPVMGAVDRARTDKSASNIQTTQQQTPPANNSGGGGNSAGLNWVDPELMTREQARRLGSRLAGSEKDVVAGVTQGYVKQDDVYVNDAGDRLTEKQVEDLKAKAIYDYHNTKNYNYLDTKKMGLPKGFEIYFQGEGSNVGGSWYKNGGFKKNEDKVRIRKYIGNDASISYDFTKNADGTGNLGSSFVEQKNNKWADNPVNVASLMLMFIPGLNVAVGSALGATGAAAGVVGSAAIQGGLAA